MPKRKRKKFSKAEAGAIGGAIKARLLATGQLPPSAARGGRPKIPRKCPKCGLGCESARAAWWHCVNRGEKDGETGS